MIGLTRDRNAVDQSFLDPDRKANLLDLYKEAYGGQLGIKAVKDRVFASTRWKKAKPQLEIETFGKCAFCEAPTSATYYGDVEHFRPKATYWWLAYCYENFLFSCRVCNGKKSDKHSYSAPQQLAAPVFPAGLSDNQILLIAEQTTPEPTDNVAVQQFAQIIAQEFGHLPHPYAEDPEPLFAWQEDEVLQEVRVEPRDASDRAQAAFDAAEDVVDLNRDELLLQRWLTYKRLLQLKAIFDVAPEPIRTMTLDIIGEMAQAPQPFAGMVRYYINDKWNLP